MRLQSEGVLTGIGPVTIRPQASIAALRDQVVELASTDPWVGNSDDIMASCIANLALKERRTIALVETARRARERDGGVLPDALKDASRNFQCHEEILHALLDDYVNPLRRSTERLRVRLVRMCRAGAALFGPSCPAYPTALRSLYAAVSELSVGYVELQAMGLAFGDRCAAAVAARHLRHVGELLLVLHTLVPYELVHQLKARGLKASTDDLWEVAGVSAIPS